MEVSELADKLHTHEGKSQERYHMTMEAIDKHHHAEMKRMEELEECVEELEEDEVTTMGATNVFETGGGLFGNNRGNEGFVTPDQLQTAVGSIVDSNQNTTILQAIGDTKLAVATGVASVNEAASSNFQALRTHLGQVENTIGAMAQSNLTAINGVNVNVLQSAAATREAVAQYGQANLTATANAQFALSQVIRDDGDKTRAILIEQNSTMLNRQLAVAEAALLEARLDGRARASEINITNTNTAVAQQAQAQQMQ